MPDALLVGEDVDFDDLPIPHCETHHRKWVPLRKPRDDSRASVHEHRLYDQVKAREAERLPSHGSRTADLS